MHLPSEGGARQSMACIAAHDRRVALRTVQVPTAVIHGREDPLLPLPHGLETAAAIPGAELYIIEQMGHTLPPTSWTQITDLIQTLARRNPLNPAMASEQQATSKDDADSGAKMSASEVYGGGVDSKAAAGVNATEIVLDMSTKLITIDC